MAKISSVENDDEEQKLKLYFLSMGDSRKYEYYILYKSPSVAVLVERD